jgi:hypothetical protein
MAALLYDFCIYCGMALTLPLRRTILKADTLPAVTQPRLLYLVRPLVASSQHASLNNGFCTCALEAPEKIFDIALEHSLKF